MDAPGNGDGSSDEDGLIAKVIPLRRRDGGDAWARSFDPPADGVFEPPEDPEPLGEYSVWETPTAQLVRREPAKRPVSAHGHWPRLPRWVGPQRWMALGALPVVGLAVAALSALPLGGSRHAPLAIGRVTSPPGLGQTLGSVTGPRPSSRGDAVSRRQTRDGSGAVAEERRRGQGTPTPEPTSPSTSPTVSVASSPPSSTSTPTPSQNASVTSVPAVASAAREFGFER
jgi:hypothetical protein